MSLPQFAPVPTSEVREIYRKYRDQDDVCRVIFELQRLRAVLDTIDDYRASFQKVWDEEIGGQQVALGRLRTLLQEERWRAGEIRDTPVRR
jgi:hypothetical protein